jgi:hypothetical protein
MPNATTFLKRRRIVALAILSPAFQGLKTQSPAGGKDRQRHMLASHWRKVSGIGQFCLRSSGFMAFFSILLN